MTKFIKFNIYIKVPLFSLTENNVTVKRLNSPVIISLSTRLLLLYVLLVLFKTDLFRNIVLSFTFPVLLVNIFFYSFPARGF